MLHRHPHLQSNILREAEVLHSLKHPRITRMHYVVHTQSYIYLLMVRPVAAGDRGCQA